MFGKPMISSEIGTGTTYINVHRETGLVVPPSDLKRCARRCARCGKARTRAAMGVAGRSTLPGSFHRR